jgi:trimeric autotransporter adhesin
MKKAILSILTVIIMLSGFSQSWLLTGNSATNPAMHFIGTTDVRPLVFKINRVNSGYLDSATFNTGFGFRSMDSISTGTFNAAFGYKALLSNTSGIDNTAIGSNALRLNKSGRYNSATGFGAMYFNNTGFNNTANGYWSLYNNTTGQDNTSLGAYALAANITGSFNVAIGTQAGASNTSGIGNIFLGYKAGFESTGGNDNIFIGSYSGRKGGINAGSNIAIGSGALENNTSGYKNTVLGQAAGRGIVSGHSNLITGYFAGSNITTGSNNTIVGTHADVDPAAKNAINASAFGSNAVATASNTMRLGNSATSVYCTAIYTSSDARFKQNISQNIPGLDFIMGLHPVSFQYKTFELDKHKLSFNASAQAKLSPSDYVEADNIIHTGFLAQELEALLSEQGYATGMVHKPATARDNYSIAYDELIAPLVKALQEQQHIIRSLQKESTELKRRIEKVEAAQAKTPFWEAITKASFTLP